MNDQVSKPFAELCDIDADSQYLDNLAGGPDCAVMVDQLRATLDNPVCCGVCDLDEDALVSPVWSSFVAQREGIAGEWVLQRTIGRIALAVAH